MGKARDMGTSSHRSMERVGANKADHSIDRIGRSDSVPNVSQKGIGRPKDGPGFASPPWGRDEYEDD